MSRTGGRVVVSSLAAAYLLIFLAGVALAVSNGTAAGQDVQPLDLGLSVAFSAVPLVGAVILWHQPRNSIGRLLLAVGIGVASGALCTGWAELTHRPDHLGLPGGALAAWLACWVFVPSFGMGPWLFALFPGGRIDRRWLRRLSRLAAVGVAAAAVAQAFVPGPVSGMSEGIDPIDNPLGVSGLSSLFSAMTSVGVVVLLVFFLAALVDLVRRFRRSRGEERLQMRWMALAALILPITMVASVMSGPRIGPWVQTLGQMAFLLGIAAALGVAVLRYRLYDIDIFIRRSLLFAALSFLVVAGYLGIVAAIGSIVTGPAGVGSSLVAVGVIAVVFDPLRRRLQRGVDHLVYGRRAEPYAVLSALGERAALAVAPSDILQTVVDTIADELRLTPVTILDEDGATLAANGTGAGAGGPRCESFPVVHQGVVKGSLIVGTRGTNEALTEPERRLLRDLARQAGAAVHAQELSLALQRSREESVSAREEDRRRIRRDLHDGLGPALAAMVLRADVLADTTADEAERGQNLSILKAQLRGATEEVRRVVNGLRPPALDDLGLVQALRAQAESLATPIGSEPLRIDVRAADELPTLPAAVEVAVLRVAGEAITNVVRHAGATNCDVQLEVTDRVELWVRDDGCGITDGARGGVGLRSMTERAAELGGTLQIRRVNGSGTAVHLSIPLAVHP